MGDYGFGLLQTANIPNSSTIFGGGTFRSHTATPASTQFSPLSLSNISISSSSSSSSDNVGVSSLFLSAAAHPQNMQDELLLGVTTTQQHHSLPSERNNSNNILNKTAQPTNNNPDFGKQLDQQNRLDFYQLNHQQQQFSEFKPTANSDKFGQQMNNLQQELKKHHQQIHQQQADFGKKQQPPPPPPPLGEFNHFAQNQQQYKALNQQGSPKSDQGNFELEGPIKTSSPVAEEIGVSEANVVAAASSSPNKAKIQMESSNNHLINSSGSSAADNMLPAGLVAGLHNLQNQEMQNQQQTHGGSSSPSLPGFGTPWSVHTSSPPPPVTNSTTLNHASPMNQISNAETDNSFYPGIPSSINTAFFQSFSPVSANPCAGINVQGFNSPFSPQINVPQQQNRRSPPVMKQSPWNSHQGSGWNSGGMSWGGMHGRDHRRPGGMGIPGTMNQISPMKKPFSSNIIAPPKFPRSAASLTPKSWIEDNVFRTDSNSNTLLPLQDRTRMYDSLNMHSLENSLIDIMRAEHDPLKGRMGYPHPVTDNLLMLNGRSSLFPIDDGLLDDGHSDQMNSPNCYPHLNGERIERFSRKVFVGGLPPDIDEDEITTSFRRFGHLVVDWPHKAESKSYFPPKGYAFLLFQEESSVQALIEACIEEDGKLYLCVSSPTIKDKPVQIRPWNLSDSDFVMDGSQPLDPRKTIFVGGVPRPLRAVELAMIMDRLYGGVCYAGIDTDPELKYPKGAGRVAFSNQQSYIAAISARFVQLQHGDIDKRVEVKPYVLDDQMCDECQGARCGGKFAPFFCANVTCLQYYCEFCWANIHSRAGREFHKPLVKEGADRPRQIHFRWN
ncbi:Cytoplasmic polyadenylation element-binding protein 2 [Acipenser ruthenus]|uniref:Cytoplasmic polyadenylation element-binding protein 2 n=1 Tax=Acipenser ruthenus TaxID=7906 RepID=A0A444UHE1_ACIRT|nr:Cytoplasmic polyadenylation element-binding protein 2 [Acipenser ruthenus]